MTAGGFATFEVYPRGTEVQLIVAEGDVPETVTLSMAQYLALAWA